jgi:hypothetical protein
MTMVAADAARDTAFDRAYWVSHCEGFRVDTSAGKLGFVDEVLDADADEPVLAVRAGMLGRRILLVPAHAIDFIVPRTERLWLHSPHEVIGTRPIAAGR